MMKDFLLDSNNDIEVSNGDFVISDSDQQHIEAILLDHKGEYKEFPLLGFGIRNYLKSNVSEIAFKRDLKIALEYDNYVKAKIDLSEGFENLKIEFRK